jgi:electron transport complex protein RnfG
MAKEKLLFYSKVALPLLAICAAAALLLAGVNAFTAAKIEDNINGARNDAMKEFFPEMVSSETVAGEYTDGVTAVYSIIGTVGEIGKCVSVKSAGNDGDIELLVGFNADNTVAGVDIISSSETKQGFESPEHLGQYNGKAAPFELGNGIDAVAGVTISSNGVNNGVNAAAQAIGVVS